MKKKKSRKDYERHLNELYSDAFSLQEAIDHFCYLKEGKIKEETIASHHNNHTLGTLMRREDPIGFYAGYHNDFK